METARMIAQLRTVGLVAMLAVGFGQGAIVPALAEADRSLEAAACLAELPESGESWAAPPERGMPGEPY